MAVPAGYEALRLLGNLNFSSGGMAVDSLTGTFVKSVTSTGLITYQDSAGVETTSQLSTGGGGSITSGTGNPSGGSAAGDIYLQLDASDVVQAIWVNVAGTWTGIPRTSRQWFFSHHALRWVP